MPLIAQPSPSAFVAALGTWTSGSGALYVLMSDAIEAAIQRGEIPAGSRFPPERQLAAILHVSRTTVAAAYDLLRAKGAAETRRSSGTYARRVARQANLQMSLMVSGSNSQHSSGSPTVLDLSRSRPESIDKLLSNSLLAVADRTASVLDEANYVPQGTLELREMIAELYCRRNVPTHAGQILITSGAQQAISLLASTWLRPGSSVALENPSYLGAMDAFRFHGGNLINSPDAQGEGADAQSGLAAIVRRTTPDLVYMMAGCNYITGRPIPALTRREIQDACAVSNIPLIEDELMTDVMLPDEQPPPHLPELREPTTALVGSLSKVYWSGLRLGWIRSDSDTISRVVRRKTVTDLGTSPATQAIAVELLKEWDCVQAMRAREAADRLDLVTTLLSESLPGWEFEPPVGGRSLWIRLPCGSATQFANVAIEQGVAVAPGPLLSPDHSFDDRIRLLFVQPRDVLIEGVSRLTRAWNRYRKHNDLSGAG